MGWAASISCVGEEDRDPETGKYTPRFSDDELREAVAESEPIGTTDIAEMFNCSQAAAYKRLRALEEAGVVTSKMVGGSRVWMSTENSSAG
jgi:predicted ArsR family transcriptional regulator